MVSPNQFWFLLVQQGALLVTPSEFVRYAAIPVVAISGVGAGDAMVAGVAVGLVRGWTLARAVRYGTASATAKLQTPGTSAFDRGQVERCFEASLAQDVSDAQN